MKMGTLPKPLPQKRQYLLSLRRGRLELLPRRSRDTLVLPNTPVNMTEQSDLVTSDSTLCESEANPSPAASLHGEISGRLG